MPDIERVREAALDQCGPDDAPDFYAAALSLGFSRAKSDKLSTELNERAMRAGGMI